MRRFVIFIWGAAIVCCAQNLGALTLQAALEKTLENNPAIQQAKAALEESAGRRLTLRAISYPDARLTTIAGVQGGKRTGASSTQAFGFAQGNFAQALFDAAIPASRRRGNLEILIAEQQLNLAIVEQLHKARVAFYTALYDHSLESLRRSQRQQLEENVNSQRARFEAGATDRGTLTAATLQARELDPQIENADRAHNGALLDLAEAMGSDLGPSAKLPSPEGELRFEPGQFALESETAAALERRADLRLARLLVRAANEDQRIIEAGYYPLIRAVVSGDYIPVSGIRRGGEGSPHRSDDFISLEIRAGAAYSWRVVDNGKVGGAVLRQREAREINQLLLRKLEANVPRELARIQNDFHAIEARHKSLTIAAAVAEKNVGIVQETMAQGLASQLEFRDAENSLLATRDGILSAAYQENVARAEWDRATGRYFQFSNDTTRNVH
jgi:outer membrane protein TolC